MQYLAFADIRLGNMLLAQVFCGAETSSKCPLSIRRHKSDSASSLCSLMPLKAGGHSAFPHLFLIGFAMLIITDHAEKHTFTTKEYRTSYRIASASSGDVCFRMFFQTFQDTFASRTVHQMHLPLLQSMREQSGLFHFDDDIEK